MALELCKPLWFAFECFQLDKGAPKFFGFAELISGLALTMLVWTIMDVRYKFRIDVAPLQVRKLSVIVVLVVGSLALITDYWRATQGWVPAGHIISPEGWQLCLGAVFLAVLFAWLWLAFIRPTTFRPLNASRFLSSVQGRILRGSASELAVVASELTRSASSIIRHATDDARIAEDSRTTHTERCANTLLSLIASQKFCRAVVEGAPQLIVALFQAVSSQRKYQVYIDIFAKNIVTAAIENRNSFLYHEQDYFTSGMEGISRPISLSLCRDPLLIHHIPLLLQPESSSRRTWEVEQWEAYCRLLLEAFTSCVRGTLMSTPTPLHSARFTLREIFSDLREDLLLSELKIHDDLYRRLNTLGDLIKHAVQVLDERADVLDHDAHAVHQEIADLVLSLLEAASSVRKPYRVAMKIHDQLIWQGILHSAWLDSPTGEAIRERVHSRLAGSMMTPYPDLNGVRLIGFCLNVFGFTLHSPPYGQSWSTLHNQFLNWIQLHFAALMAHYPGVARECFVEGMYFDVQRNKLVFQAPANRLGDYPVHTLSLRPGPASASHRPHWCKWVT